MTHQSKTTTSSLLGLLQVRAYKILQQKARESLRSQEIRPIDWLLLGVVASEKDGIRLGKIALKLNVKPPMVTTIVDILVARGLIARADDPYERRAKIVLLTKLGAQFITQTEKQLNKDYAQLLQDVSEQELRGYKAVLEKIIQNSSVNIPETVVSLVE